MSLYDPPGKTILLHNPRGLRAELNFHQDGGIELWYSPRVKSSANYRDRNFSNRDDHMRVWDRIQLPGLGAEEFVGCEYDPFHVTVHFKSQRMRLAIAYDAPLIYLDFSADQSVDFKSCRTDHVKSREPEQFRVMHHERSMDFQFIAQTRLPCFQHQLVPDVGRSTYARARLKAGELLVIGGELLEEVPDLKTAIADVLVAGYTGKRDRDENHIEAALRPGSFSLREQAGLERLVHVNRRVLLAMQDQQGAIRAAMNRIYYLIWVRDGSIIEVFQAHSGLADGLTRWKNFLLANPVRVEVPGLKGWMFGQLVNPITKWQEDGLFYAVWAVFQNWTQTGTPPSVDELFLLEEAADWYERYCFDATRGLFARTFACETPFKGCRDFGIDGAVGNPADARPMKFAGAEVRRSFDLYVNLLNWNVYLMLAEMSPELDKIRVWRTKAESLRKALLPLLQHDPPHYGWIELADGRVELATGDGLDRTDYQWALSLTPYYPLADATRTRRRLFDQTVEKPTGCFLAGYFSILLANDPLDTGEEAQLRAIQYAAAQSQRPGEFLPMPDTVVEMLDVADGDLHHDVRPQAFSIGPLLAALTGLGLRRLPHGLALRPTRLLRKLEHYEYQGRILRVFFEPDRVGLSVNHEEISHSWQIPEENLRERVNEIHFAAAAPSFPETPTLLCSSCRLLSVKSAQGLIHYEVDAFGWNDLRFALPEDRQLSVYDRNGTEIPVEISPAPGGRYLHFRGTGDFQIQIR